MCWMPAHWRVLAAWKSNRGRRDMSLWTRSGNVEQPIRGWSEWQPVKDGSVASPAGRFLQWKAVLQRRRKRGQCRRELPAGERGAGGRRPGGGAGCARNFAEPTGTAAYDQHCVPFSEPGNTITTDESGSTQPITGNERSHRITVRWAAHDENGDDLIYSLYLRGDGEHTWRLLKDKITDKAYSFDATLIPDGGYQIKVVASDAPSHAPGDALTSAKVSDRFEVDTTPPVVTALTADRGSSMPVRTAPCPRNSPCDVRRRGCHFADRARRILARCGTVAVC